MARSFGGRVKVVLEDFGASELARKYGLARYPAVFVNDVLVAKPKDFGFYGSGGSQGTGRYTPWLEPASQARFKDDLERILGLAVKGDFASIVGVAPDAGAPLARVPALHVKDLDDFGIDLAEPGPDVTLVDFWATWCPPCRAALPWLSRLQEEHPGALRVVGIAVESEEAEVRQVAADGELAFPVVLGTPELAAAFGDLVAVPTLFVFDAKGDLLRVFYGAGPSLHDDVEAILKQELGS